MCSEDQVPLLKSDGGEGDGGCGEAAPMIIRPKDKLREEIRAAKKRRKEEKRRYKEEKEHSKGEQLNPDQLRARLEKLQLKNKGHSEKGEGAEFVAPQVTFERPKQAPATKKAPKKYVQLYTVYIWLLHA